MEIGLLELIEPPDTLNYKPLFKNCMLQTILQIFFLLLIFAWNKIFGLKNWAVFYICLAWFGVAFSGTVLNVLCFWCSLWKVKENQGFFSYSRYNLLGIAIKTPLRNVWQYIFPTLVNALLGKNSEYKIYIIDYRSYWKSIFKRILELVLVNCCNLVF